MVVNQPGQDEVVVHYDSGSPTTVYDTSTCLTDVGFVVGCYKAGFSHVEMSSDGQSVFFSVSGEGVSGERVDSVVRSNLVAGGWGTPTLLLRGNSYYTEPSVESLDASESLLAVRYLAGFQQNGIRDDRIIFLDLSCVFCDPSNPVLPPSVIQDVSSWHASWTVQNTVLLLGKQGKGRKLVHPIEEFEPDPSSGLRTPLGITLEDHPIIDSSM